MYSANLIGKQMDTEFGLYLPEYSIPAPEVQTNYKEIPFRDGAIDKTSPNGVVHYKDREWDLTFKKTGTTVSASDLAALAMSVMNAIHGKAGEIIFDDDPNYKWVGRVFVTSVNCENNGLLIVNIHMITHPYKYSLADIVVVDEIQTTSDEYEGSIVSLTGGIGKSITELLVSFSPIQDLHGYENPWPAGGGVNKLEINSAIAGTYNQCTFTVADDGTIRVSGTPTQQTRRTLTTQTFSGIGTIVLSGTIPTGIRIFCRRVGGGSTTYPTILNGTTLDTATYTFDSFALEVNTTFDGTAVDLRLQIESGSSPTSWSPYSNICPISGRTGLSVYRTGKNLYSRENSEYNVPVYAQNGSSASYPDVAVWWIKVNPSTKYTISLGETPSSTTYVRWINCDENKGFISRPGGTYKNESIPVTITTPSGCYWVQIAVNEYQTSQISRNDWKLQIEESDTATSYEAFGNTYSIDWTSEAGTVYGGTLDVVSGLLTVDTANIASYNGETITEPWISSMDAYVPGGTPTTGAQVVYTLATPLTYQLTAQEVALLVGTNNIWSTGDSVSVTLSTMDKVTLVNHGKPMNPKINVVSEGSISLLFEIDGTRYTAALSSGEYTLPDLVLFDGSTDVYEAGEGTITYTYPEVSL